ncbi:RidA family protein [Kordiimonas pumila]|uniref:RidA family protein n=1 Tax=Kordiimonas pumila TaxID=2161677 RepID=A0ABV7D638_9PROT|nr:RidA family protein [Kordiimonas pumila]
MIKRKDYFNEWEPTQKQLGYSQAVKVGDTLYIAGSAALDPDFVPMHVGDFGAQLTTVYEKLKETLEHHEMTASSVVKEVMYATDMSKLVDCMAIRKSFYGDGPFPAATGVEVTQLFHPDLMIEIEMVAIADTK